MEIALPMAMPDYFEKTEARILQEFAEAIATWGESATALAAWEDEHLLDNLTPENLATRRCSLERLIGFGKFIARTTDHSDFSDTTVKETVEATLQTLRDKIPLWHSRMPKEEGEAILKAAFPE